MSGVARLGVKMSLSVGVLAVPQEQGWASRNLGLRQRGTVVTPDFQRPLRTSSLAVIDSPYDKPRQISRLLRGRGSIAIFWREQRESQIATWGCVVSKPTVYCYLRSSKGQPAISGQLPIYIPFHAVHVQRCGGGVSVSDSAWYGSVPG